MRIAFAGTPEFAAESLRALLQSGHEVALVLTQPDRPAGRGMKLQASPVKQLAQAHELRVLQPQGLKLDGRYAVDAAAAREALLACPVQLLVVAAYGLILPRWVLDWPPMGCLNIHASLLPRWRGAAPIHRAIEAGDARTGITIMQMDEGLDTGDMLLSQALDIGPRETTGSLHDRLAVLGGQLIVQALQHARDGTLARQPQPTQGITYAHKISKDEARLDWREDAQVLDRRIRAFDPAPGAQASYGGTLLKCWAAEPGSAQGEPGRILRLDEHGIEVTCGTGSLRLTELQRPGGRRLPVREFLAGCPASLGLAAGGVFDLPAS